MAEPVPDDDGVIIDHDPSEHPNVLTNKANDGIFWNTFGYREYIIFSDKLKYLKTCLKTQVPYYISYARITFLSIEKTSM